jgi:hypothetical protein
MATMPTKPESGTKDKNYDLITVAQLRDGSVGSE